jgi:hypothetical protein
MVPVPLTARWATSPRCEVFRTVYHEAEAGRYTSWNQIEETFLASMSSFDTSIAASTGATLSDDEKSELGADLQNGKGDFFNDLLVLLLERCSGVDLLTTRRIVPGLIVPRHNLDGVFPATGQVRFMLEAKMMGTPKHVNSPKQRAAGRPGSADIDKRVKELAFKSIALKGEFSRLQAMHGNAPRSGGAGGGDLTTWLRSVDPKIFFFIAVRVVNDADFERTIQWASTAQQVLDAVGVYCFEPDGRSFTTYRKREGVPADLQLERVLYKACVELQAVKNRALEMPDGP